jgi:hypothetical protein
MIINFQIGCGCTKKIEARVSNCCYMCLSRSGKLVLIKSILESILVYWMDGSGSHSERNTKQNKKKCFQFFVDR